MQSLVDSYLKKGQLLSPKFLNNNSQIPQAKSLVIEPEQTTTKILEKISPQHHFSIRRSYKTHHQKIKLRDFVDLYTKRYKALMPLLRQRQELAHVSSIAKLSRLNINDQVSCIGLVLSIGRTKNDNIMLTLEDQTGIIKAVVTQKNEQAFALAKDLCHDEVIGVTGTLGGNIIFVNSIIQPDLPLGKAIKKSPVDEAVVFISDIHVGSTVFLEEEFKRFISWIRGEYGNAEQKALADKVKYLIIGGDVVEGIGIFPGQEEELIIKDLYDQFALFTSFLYQIPDHITIFICPGNHDPVRIAEPQPPLPKALMQEIEKKEHIHLVSSPSIITIGKHHDFEGFDILLYHGYSFPYYASNIESLRFLGGLESTENIMKYLLKRRHLAPAHGSTQYQLGYDHDPLVIDHVPDFFVTGHIHRASILQYKSVTLLNCSCWLSQTPYQEKRGLVPQPAKAMYVHLQTRETLMIDFEHESQ